MPKPSQQASSEPEGDHQQVVSEAGCSEFAGRVYRGNRGTGEIRAYPEPITGLGNTGIPICLVFIDGVSSL